ncbi:M56 family metallopeptidase [Roseivirga pacifica]
MNTLIETSQQLLNWSIQAGVTLLLLFACYYLLFRNNTALKLRRSLLLSLVGLSLLAPFIELPKNDIAPQVYVPKFEFTRTTPSKPKVQVNAVEKSQTSPVQKVTVATTSYSTMDYIAMAFAIGAGISALMFMLQLIRIYWLVRHGTTEWQKGTKLVKHSLIQSPFSFLNWIFVPTEKYDNDTWKILMAHEHAHLQQKHSLDILFTRTIATLTWYNPAVYLVIQELRQLHESLADEQVLKATSVRDYSKTLLAFSFDTSPKLAQAFSLKTSIKKRLTHMQQTKTNWKKTVTSSALLIIICITLVGAQSQTVISEQAQDQEEAFQEARKRFRQLIPILATNKLTQKHQRIIDVLKAENPDKNVRFKYSTDKNFKSYYDNYMPGYSPLYISQMSKEDKDNLVNIYLNDTTTINMNGMIKLIKDGPYFNYKDFIPDVSEAIHNNANYIMMYEYVHSPSGYDKDVILGIDEVDIAPQVMGGIENLAKTIALDITMPEELDRSKLPETIDFEFVVQGGGSITHLNLLTELRGSDKKNAPYYQFFGEVHNVFRSKVSSLYPWKRGIKDSKEVPVRMKISIPTKYIQ